MILKHNKDTIIKNAPHGLVTDCGTLFSGSKEVGVVIVTDQREYIKHKIKKSNIEGK